MSRNNLPAGDENPHIPTGRTLHGLFGASVRPMDMCLHFTYFDCSIRKPSVTQMGAVRFATFANSENKE